MSLKKYQDIASTKIEKQSIVPKNKETESKEIMKEEVLLAPKVIDNNLNIEILEEKIIKFNSGLLKDILETLKSKYSDTDYFIRKKDNELHIVKYNENLKLNINQFINSLLKYYSINNKRITEGIKVKGNDKFSIIENMKNEFINKFVDDLTKLLVKKNNNM